MHGPVNVRESVVFPERGNVPTPSSMEVKRSSANGSVVKISQPPYSPNLKVSKYFLYHKVLTTLTMTGFKRHR